jgi:cell division protein FtsL
MGRVWLSVQATEASTRSSELRMEIKNARYQGDMLEVRQSALGSPSRIRAIASQTMGMIAARKVAMIDIAPETARAGVVPAPKAERSGADRVIQSLMDLTAGEAQVLLVGDVGLASAK